MRRRDFWQAFRDIGAVRSSVLTSTNVLACTATATEATYIEVVKVLIMENPHVVAMPPERPNIMYSVLPKKSLDAIADTVCLKQSLFHHRSCFPKSSSVRGTKLCMHFKLSMVNILQ